MKLVIIVYALPNIAMAASGELRSIPSARTEQAISAYTPIGPMLLPAREILVEGKYPDGKPALGNLLILFDPASSRFLWSCHTFWAPTGLRGVHGPLPPHKLHLMGSLQNGQAAVYADMEHLTVFWFSLNVEVYVRESSGKADSLNDAEKQALQEATNLLSILENNQMYGWKTVSLSKELGRDFTSPKDSVLPGSARFFGVARKDDHWQIILKGQWKEQITLDDKFDFVKQVSVK